MRFISRFVLFWPCKDRCPEQNITGYKSPQVYWTKSLLVVTHYTSPAVVSCKCHSFQLLDPLANNVLEIGSTEQCAVLVQWQQASWISQISASLLEALQCRRKVQKSGGVTNVRSKSKGRGAISNARSIDRPDFVSNSAEIWEGGK